MTAKAQLEETTHTFSRVDEGVGFDADEDYEEFLQSRIVSSAYLWGGGGGGGTVVAAVEFVISFQLLYIFGLFFQVYSETSRLHFNIEL